MKSNGGRDLWMLQNTACKCISCIHFAGLERALTLKEKDLEQLGQNDFEIKANGLYWILAGSV